MTPNDVFEPDNSIPPACRPTVERLQGVFDAGAGAAGAGSSTPGAELTGDLTVDALDADPHLATCADCRERVAAARLLVSVLATPAAPTKPPAELTNRILDALAADGVEQPGSDAGTPGTARSSRPARRRWAFAFVGLALAASVALVVWLRWPADTGTPDTANTQPGNGGNSNPAPAPAPVPEPQPNTNPKPLRIGDELSKAGLALREAPRPISESAAMAPLLFSKVSDALTKPTAPGGDIETPTAALAEIPDAARTGLEPVTGTAQKAFTRLLRDVGGVQFTPKPKS
jgi:hypothetical protein